MWVYHLNFSLLIIISQILLYPTKTSAVDCPEFCTCYSETAIVTCPNTPHKTIPDLPLNTTQLYMKDSDLRTLDEAFTDLSKYKYLTDAQWGQTGKIGQFLGFP